MIKLKDILNERRSVKTGSNYEFWITDNNQVRGYIQVNKSAKWHFDSGASMARLVDNKIIKLKVKIPKGFPIPAFSKGLFQDSENKTREGNTNFNVKTFEKAFYVWMDLISFGVN